MQKSTEEKTIQTIAAVASLVGLSLKKATTGDDLKEFTLTLAFTGVSAGLVQERFDFEREDTRVVAQVNGRGEVTDLQVGDLAETGEQADKEINDAAAAALTSEMDERESSGVAEPENINPTGDAFEPGDPNGMQDAEKVVELTGKKRR